MFMNSYASPPRKLIPFLRRAKTIPVAVSSRLPVSFLDNGDILITHASGSWIRISSGPDLAIFSYFFGGPMDRDTAGTFNYVLGDLFCVGHTKDPLVCSVSTQEHGPTLLCKGDSFCVTTSLAPNVRIALAQLIAGHVVGGINTAFDPVDPGKGVLREMRAAFPALNYRVRCPVHEVCAPGALSKMIIHLNDREQWTREQIADWIETLDVSINAV